MIKPGWRTWTVFLESLDKKDERHKILVKHNAWKVHFPSQIVLTEVASYVGNKIRVSVAVKALCAGFKNKKAHVISSVILRRPQKFEKSIKLFEITYFCPIHYNLDLFVFDESERPEWKHRCMNIRMIIKNIFSPHFKNANLLKG